MELDVLPVKLPEALCHVIYTLVLVTKASVWSTSPREVLRRFKFLVFYVYFSRASSSPHEHHGYSISILVLSWLKF